MLMMRLKDVDGRAATYRDVDVDDETDGRAMRLLRDGRRRTCYVNDVDEEE